MKPHLPLRLLLATLAAMGTAPTVLSTAQAEAMQPDIMDYRHQEIYLQEDFTASAKRHYTFSSEVRILDGRGKRFTCEGEGYSQGSLTIIGENKSSITLKNITLQQASVVFSDCTAQVDKVTIEGKTQLIFNNTDAHLHQLDKHSGQLTVDMQNGSKVIGPFHVTRGTEMRWEGPIHTNRVEGDLSLEGGSISFGGNWISKNSNPLELNTPKLTITGTLSLREATRLNLTFYDLGEGEEARPASGQAFLACRELTGSISQLKPYLITADFDTGSVTSEGSIDNMEFTSRPTEDGYLVYLVESLPQEQPSQPSQPGSGGTGSGGSEDDGGHATDRNDITIAAGQSVDISGRQQTSFDASRISGTGTLITRSDQAITAATSREITYSLTGSSGKQPGATLIFGQQGGTITSQTSSISGPGDQHLHLNGLIIHSGIVDHHTTATSAAPIEIGPGSATLNNYGSINARQGITIGQGSALDNRGAIRTPAGIIVRAGAIFANNSTVGGNITVEKGGLLKGTGSASSATISGTLNVGNSPGFQQYESLTLNASAHLIFTVDGATPATITRYGGGTHSQISVTTPGGLTVNGTPTAQIIFTDHAVLSTLQSGSMTLPLTLITVNDAEGTPVDATTTAGITYSVGGDLANFITLDASSGALVADLNSAAVLMGMEGSARDLANTLWSSTMVVNSFARQASAQISPARRLSTGEQKSGMSVWGAGLGDFTSVGGADGFTYSGGGYAVGVDGTLNGNLRGGIAFGQQWGTFKSDARGTKVDQDSTMVGIYGGYSSSADKLDYQITGYAAYGSTTNDSRTSLGGISTGRGSWDNDTYTWGLKAELVHHYSERASIGAFIGLDYLYGTMGSFSELYDSGLSRNVSDGAMQVWRMPIGITWKGEYSLGGTQYLLPAISLAYVGDISRSNPHLNTESLGMQNRAKGSDIGRNGLLLNAGATWLISDQWSASASYNLEVRSGQTAQSVNAGVRYAF